MTEMQRYTPRWYADEAVVVLDPEGRYVLASDAEAAIAAAQVEAAKVWEQMSYDTGYAAGKRDGYKEGYGAAMDDGWGEPGHIRKAERDTLARCIEAVYALVTTRGYDLDDYSAAEAVAALRALGGSDA